MNYEQCLLGPSNYQKDPSTGQQTLTIGAGKECIRMLSTCPPRVTGVALAVSSCPTARCYWCCSGRLKLSDGQVLLVLLWPSQAVDGPGTAGIAVRLAVDARSAGLRIRLLLLDGPVLLVLLWPSQAVDDQVLLQRCFPLNR